MKTNEFKFRYGNIELRSCDKHLIDDGPHTTAEIIHYTGKTDSAITVAYWSQNDEGYNLQFVHSRPLEVNWRIFRIMYELGQKILDYNFEEKQSEEE